MGGPAMDERGVRDRGTTHRIAGPEPGAPQEYPAFHVSTLGLIGPSAIPDALAYALKWQLEFMRTAGPLASRKELADNLIAIWHFLKEMEEKAPRAPDGALLVRDPIAAFSRARIETDMVELATGETILVARKWEDAPLPAWAPSLFPNEMLRAQRARYPARPKSVEEIPPFSNETIRQWILTSVYAPERADAPPPALPSPGAGAGGKVAEAWVITEPEEKPPGDEEEVQKALDDAARKIDRIRWTSSGLAAFKGATPTVSAAIARLASTTLADIQRHTGVTFKPEYLNDPLLKYTEVILYHSVYSFVLDRDGEPFDLRSRTNDKGMIDYPILVEGPGSQVRRHVPPDDGLYVSVQKLGYSIFRLNDDGIAKVLLGTVGGFKKYGYGASETSELQKALQQYIDRYSPLAYAAGITVPSAYSRREITLSRIRNRIPQFIEAVIPHAVNEIIARARRKLDNWEKFLAELRDEIIREFIFNEIRDKIRDYLKKKIGKRIVPGVNLAFAVYDLAAGDTERMRMRNAIACMMVALRSDSDEDMTIAARTTSKIMGDEFEDAVLDALIKRSRKTAAKLKRKRKLKEQRDKDESGKEPEPGREHGSQGDVAPVKPADAPASAPHGAAEPAGSPKADTGGKPATIVPRSEGDSPESSTGAQSATASRTPADRSAPRREQSSGARRKADTPRPPSKREREAQERWAEKQRRHEEKLQQKIEEAKEKEKKKLAANADPGATEDNGTGGSGAARKSRATDGKGTGGDSAGTNSAGSANAGTAANPANAGTRRRSTAQPPPPPPPGRPPPDPNEERGTLEKPRKVPAQPVPEVTESEKVRVKEPEALPDTQHVHATTKPRLGRATHEKVARDAYEAAAGATPLDHDQHHHAPKAGGGQAGEDIRDSLSQSSVSVDETPNVSPERGLPRDPRAPHESSSQHWGLHKKVTWEAMRRELETVKGDPEATRDVLKKYGVEAWEDRPHQEQEFYLGPDPEPPDPPEPRKPRKK